MTGLIDLGSALAPFASKLADLIPDPAAKAAAAAQLQLAQMQMQVQLDTAQLAVNQAEAANKSGFVAGWRPFIGWVCGAALAYEYIAGPFLSWAINLVHPGLPPLPPINDVSLGVLTTNLLGMGAMRTFEKVKGVAATGAQ